MKYIILVLALALVPLQVQAQIKVAVIDTGFDAGPENVPLCAAGHRNFTQSDGLTDGHIRRHGTNVAGLIAQGAGSGNWCLIILKVHNGYQVDFAGYIQALKYATTLDVDFINISMSGGAINGQEFRHVRSMLDKGVVIVAAAGNDGLDLNTTGCVVYPLCVDKRIIGVGNTSYRSNRGRIVDHYVDGHDKTAGGVTLSGSSQSAAIVTGLLVKAKLEGAAK